MEFNYSIYKLMIRAFNMEKIPLDDCLAMLWQSKRLSHVLCASPIDEAFFVTFSKHSKSSKSVQYCKNCMNKSKALKVDFKRFLSAISTLSFPDSSSNLKHVYELEVQMEAEGRARHELEEEIR